MAFQSEELESVTQVPFVTFSPKVDVIPGFNVVVVAIIAVRFKFINSIRLAQ